MSDNKFDHIDRNERKELYEQFVAYGGKVVDEQNKKQLIDSPPKGDIQRNKNKDSNTLFKSSTVSKHSKELDPEQEEILFQKYLQSYKVGFIRRWIIGFKCYFARITNSSGTLFTTHFRLLTDKSQEFLSSIKDINHYILTTQSFQNLEILESFYKNFPLYYEIMIRIKKINLNSIYVPFKEASWNSVASVKEAFYEMIRQYYCFMLQDGLVINSFRKAFQVIVTLKESDVKIISSKLDIAKQALLSFEDFLKKIDMLFPLFSGYDFLPNSTGGKKILGIEGEYSMGGLDQYIKDSFMKMKNKEERKNYSKEAAASFEVEDKNAITQNISDIGSKIIKSVKLNQQELYQPDMAFYPKRDKVYIVSGLLDFFVKRYSLILSFSKIKFIQTMKKGVRVSIQDAFRDFYIELAKIQRSIKDYTHFMKVNEALQDRLLDSTTGQEPKNQLSINIRYQTRVLLEKILAPLEVIVTSIPEYVVDFDISIQFANKESIGGESYFRGKTPAEAIHEFYSFIKYFVYLLARDELAGPSTQIDSSSDLFDIKED